MYAMNTILNACSLEHDPQAIVCAYFIPFGAIYTTTRISLLRQQLYTQPASNAPSHLMSTHQKELKLTKTYAQQRMKLSNILLACSRL